MEKIRIERIESREALQQCAVLLTEVYNAEPWNDNWTEETALEKLEYSFNAPKFFGLMAWEETHLLGCCVGNIEPYFMGDYFYLRDMFVSVSSQRKGVGSQLINSLKEYLETFDIKAIILFTSSEHFTFNFYQKNDFKIMEGMCIMLCGQTEAE